MFAIIGLDRLGPTCDPAFGGGKAHAGAVSDEDVRPVLCFPAADGPVVLTLRDACRLINLATFQYVSAEAKKAMGGQSITRADLVRTFSPEGPPSSGRECFVLPMRGV
jgi:hypothetical protein